MKVTSPHSCRLVDPTMAIILKMTEDFLRTGGTMEKLGILMGYPKATARKSVSQFLRSADPRMSLVRRFADAFKIDVQELLVDG